MEGIQGLRPQTFVSAPAAQNKKTSSSAPSFQDTFTFTTNQPTEPEKPKPLTAEQQLDLGSRYDIEEMTRTQFNAYLKELRDAGAITQKAFSDVYTEAMPQGANFKAMPTGDESVDFMEIMLSRKLAYGVADTSSPRIAALKESYDQVYKVINNINILSSRYWPPEKTADKIIKRTATTPEELGLPDLTGLNDVQKLKVLADLHDATNYCGMDDVSKYKLIQDRFEAVFPHQLMYSTYWFGGRYDNTVPWDGSSGPRTFKDDIRDEQERQWKGAEIWASPTTDLHCQAYYGGRGQSDATVEAIICRRHSGGTAADQKAILEELRFWYGGGPDNSVTGTLFGLLEKDFRGMDPETPFSWQDLKQLVADRSQNCEEMLRNMYDQLLEDIEKLLP